MSEKKKTPRKYVKRTGRPPLDYPRTVRVPVAVSVPDGVRVKRVAAHLGTHPSTLAREALMKAVDEVESTHGLCEK